MPENPGFPAESRSNRIGNHTVAGSDSVTRRGSDLLTDIAVRQAKARGKPYKMADGRGLYLLVTDKGSKLWRFDYRFAGKRKTLSFGVYPDVSLAKARKRRDEARELIADEVDPAELRREKKVARATTFSGVAEDWLASARGGWSEAHAETVRYRLHRYLIPKLGDRPIGEIEPPEMLRVLRPLADRADTARRAKQIAGAVFRYAIAHGLARRDPTADLKGALPAGTVRARAAITDPRQMGPLMRAIEAYEGHPIVRQALRLLPLVFVRPGELRHAEWPEIDLGAAEWRIPAEKMKMREAHLVPLSKQARAILEEIRPLTGRGRYVFPSVRSVQRPLSENTLNAALRRLGYTKAEMTSHGFRAMASSLLNEQGWPPEVIERQLAHAERNTVRAAYNRASYLAERRRMMQHWADYLDSLLAGVETGPRSAA